jgi:hypothetical protein
MENNNQVGMMFDIPNQNVSYTEKIVKDFEWGKLTINAIIGRSTFTTNTWKLWLKKLYDYYNGNIHIDDYKLITEPFGKPIEGSWSDVENYPIIKTKVDLLRSEYSKRPKRDMVYVVNDDVVTNMTEALNEQINKGLEEEFVNRLNELGVPTGVEAQQPETPERIKEQFEASYLDKRAINGQKAINYIKTQQNLDEKFDLEFFHWLVSGEVYSYKDVVHNETVYEAVNTLDIDFDKDPDLQFVEDGDWVVRRKYMHPSSIIDTFYDELSPEEIKMIDTLAITGPALNSNSAIFFDRSSSFKQWSRLIEVMHVCWKSRKKIGIVDFVDELGQFQSLEVDEIYKPSENETVTWYWVSEVWEGYRLGTSMFKKIRAIPNQRGNLDNISKCKLPYNGRVMSNVNSTNVSLVSLGIPYQTLYNATFHRLKLAMAKMKDDMALIDMNWKPIGWSMDKWLEYADRVSMLFVDYSKDSVRMNATHQTRLQLASQTINMYTELLAFIKNEWEEVCGITRQREGQVNSSETVGGVERAVLQSSLITETYFTLFDQFRKRDLQGLIDYSKIAWINGKKSSFVMPDSTVPIYMDINGVEHCETEYGIGISDSSKEQERANTIKQLAQPMMQNGIAASAIAEVLDSDTISEAKVKLKAAERKLQEYEQFVAQQEQQANIALADKQKEVVQLQHEYNLEAIDRKGEWEMRKAELTALGMDEGDDNTAIQESMIEAGLKQQELGLKNKEIMANQLNDDKRMKHEAQMKEKDAQIKREEMRSKEKIARSKPKPKAK